MFEGKECSAFEDKSEWAHLPCKVGDKIYFKDDLDDQIKERRVDLIIKEVCTTHRNEIDYGFDFSKFGKTVFLTREEAEKALAERRKK